MRFRQRLTTSLMFWLKIKLIYATVLPLVKATALPKRITTLVNLDCLFCGGRWLSLSAGIAVATRKATILFL